MKARIIEEPSFREHVYVFQDRFQAGIALADKLVGYANQKNVILLALPAGGVPVCDAIAKKLGILMDLLVVRKVQIPWNTEAGFGAVTWDGEIVLNEPLAKQLGLTSREIDEAILKTKKIIEDRVGKFRGDKPMPNLKDKIVIIVDDGLASGFTMLAAAKSIKRLQPKKIVVAVPTASMGAIQLISPEVDEIISLNIRSGPLFAVANAYKNWYDLTDEEVKKIFKRKAN